MKKKNVEREIALKANCQKMTKLKWITTDERHCNIIDTPHVCYEHTSTTSTTSLTTHDENVNARGSQIEKFNEK